MPLLKHKFCYPATETKWQTKNDLCTHSKLIFLSILAFSINFISHLKNKREIKTLLNGAIVYENL